MPRGQDAQERPSQPPNVPTVPPLTFSPRPAEMKGNRPQQNRNRVKGSHRWFGDADAPYGRYENPEEPEIKLRTTNSPWTPGSRGAGSVLGRRGRSGNGVDTVCERRELIHWATFQWF